MAIDLEPVEDQGLDAALNGGTEVDFGFLGGFGAVGMNPAEEFECGDGEADEAFSVEGRAGVDGFEEGVVKVVLEDGIREVGLVLEVSVERGAVDGGAVGDVGDGNLGEMAFADEVAEGVFEEGAGALDPRIDLWLGGTLDGFGSFHDFSGSLLLNQRNGRFAP